MRLVLNYNVFVIWFCSSFGLCRSADTLLYYGDTFILYRGELCYYFTVSLRLVFLPLA